MTRTRTNFTKGQKLAAFEAAGGRCVECTRKILPGDLWQLDHDLPSSLGGKSTPENARVLCNSCHAIKTGTDRKMIAKADRIAKKHTGIKRRKGPPMPGTKASGIKKRMNGDVIWR